MFRITFENLKISMMIDFYGFAIYTFEIIKIKKEEYMKELWMMASKYLYNGGFKSNVKIKCLHFLQTYM